jgi:cyclopropane-fatty-acyl-phospholipid synthase
MLRYRLLDRSLRHIPDPALRAGSRVATRNRLRRERRGGVEAQEDRQRALMRHMSGGPLAELPEKANEQHYELPAEFFGLFLGPRRKYSGCLWEDGVTTLAQAEEAMLALTCERAQVRDGMEILDLGCGWGSLSLYLAERYPHARILAVSNSSSQREYIEAHAPANVEVRTADANDFEPGRTFDRVISIEMFEHLRNWREALRRVSEWLKPDGRAFVHVFSHRALGYRFENTWAAERFFTAGTMPSHDLLLRFQDDLVVEDRWAVPGTHYARTLRAWRERLDENRAEALRHLDADQLAAWRLFLLSTEEIWGWNGGDEWLVSHYRLAPRGGSGTKPEVRAT